MNRIRRLLARRAGSAGIAWLRARQPARPAAGLPAGPGPGGFAGQFIQQVAAAASVAAGQQPGRPSRPARPVGGGRGPAMATPPRRTVTPPGLLPRTVQLCIHCQQHPAGFWVSRTGGQTVRRPWCLSCCQQLDRDRCHVIPFDS